MSRIASKFDDFRHNGHKGFIPFISAGDPNIAVTQELLRALADAGADIIELGVPFSDPMADGPTIQRSSQRALENGVDLRQILDAVRSFRKNDDAPIVLFSYLNPLLRFGLEKLCDEAADAGVDGVLVTDAIGDEASGIRNIFGFKDIDLISLIAPTTTDERLAAIGCEARGFLYAVSRAGVTGARTDLSTDAESLVSRARRFSDLPIAVGFGISTRAHVQDVWGYADAAVVGSAIVAEIEQNLHDPELPNRIRSFAASLIPEFAKSLDEN